MQLIIKILLNEPLKLPLSYHHIEQAMFYRLMGAEGSSALHDSGFRVNKRIYKLFTFGPIEGRYQISDGKISFFDTVRLEFRSIDQHIIDEMVTNLSKEGININNTICRDIIVQCNDYHVDKEDIYIRMISPVTVHKTELNEKRTIYFTPSEKEFIQAVTENFRRKYQAYTGINDFNDIDFECTDVDMDDKYITKYKGFIIEGYKGIYRLRGEKSQLDFLYNTGIGDKNSQGFGMFDVCKYS